MAATASGPLGSRDAAGFAAAYGAVRGILAVQYWRVRGLSVCRSIVRRRIIGLTLAAALWTTSAFLPTPQRYIGWCVALLVDGINSWSPTPETLRLPPGAIHFPERFGLLTIILLGEFVASVMRGIESQSTWSLPAASAAILSMAFGFAVWSCYSDGAAGWEERALHSARDVLRQRAWIFLHLLLFLSIGAVGVGARRAISLGGQASFDSFQGWILCDAAAVMMLAIIGIAATTSTTIQRRSLRWPWLVGIFVVCLTFLLGHFASRISATFVVTILFLIVVTETALLTLARGMDAELEQI
jgi:low temperature requirement protein LtrA